jgi:hypothetical protein
MCFSLYFKWMIFHEIFIHATGILDYCRSLRWRISLDHWKTNFCMVSNILCCRLSSATNALKPKDLAGTWNISHAQNAMFSLVDSDTLSEDQVHLSWHQHVTDHPRYSAVIVMSVAMLTGARRVANQLKLTRVTWPMVDFTGMLQTHALHAVAVTGTEPWHVEE